MDPITLATGLAALLAPLLPRLTGLGDDAAHGAAEAWGHQIGVATLQKVADVWRRLWPALKGRDASIRAVERVGLAADSPEGLRALAVALEPILWSDPNLARDATTLLGEVPWAALASSMTVVGNLNTTVVGNGNTTSFGKYHIGSVNGPVELGDRFYSRPPD